MIFSCKNVVENEANSINNYIDNILTGFPIIIEISNNDKLSIKIESDTLYRYNDGNTIMFGGVYADLYDNDGIKSSELHADTAIIFSNSDSVKAKGNIVIESINKQKLLTSEITLYNNSNSVFTNKSVMFTSNRDDTLYGDGFWSNFKMTNSKILKPKGVWGGDR